MSPVQSKESLHGLPDEGSPGTKREPVENSLVPYHEPVFLGTELTHIRSATRKPGLASGGEFSMRVTEWLERGAEQSRVFLTTSGTKALEMAALLCDL